MNTQGHQHGAVIAVDKLCRSYGPIKAVDNVSFCIPEGSIWGLLGPNGAGKTSIIEMIEGLRRPDSGTISVHGLDPFRDTRRVRRLIGAQLQSVSIPDKLRVVEALKLFSSFYDHPIPTSELLDLIGLSHKRNSYFEHLSGGEKQRVAIALALVGNPRVLFLDEPTTGLDAESRQQLHELIKQFRDQRRTIVLTTHYIEEAEKLCDEVGILDHGRLCVTGRPRELIATLGEGERLEVVLRMPLALENLARWVGPGVKITVEGQRYTFRGPNATKTLAEVAVNADRQNNEVIEARILRVTLEDVYLQVIKKGKHESTPDASLFESSLVVSS